MPSASDSQRPARFDNSSGVASQPAAKSHVSGLMQPGQRIGMIKLGSRVELLAPDELAGLVQVRLGQKVFAGETVLALPKVQERP